MIVVMTVQGCWAFLKSKYEVEKWIDIESALFEFATVKTRNRDFDRANEDAKDYALLCCSLKKIYESNKAYLNRLIIQ